MGKHILQATIIKHLHQCSKITIEEVNFMTINQTKCIIDLLAKKDVAFDSGLSDNEVVQIESKFNLIFPPDLKLFLQTALPISDRFVNWRLGLHSSDEEKAISERLNWPLDGMLFDIQNNNYWCEDWGAMPDNQNDRIEIAKKHYETYPQLIPIYSHRYIPSRPCENGNPVFSVYQTDIICYGLNLESYLACEFDFTLGMKNSDSNPLKTIEFWSNFI